MFLLWHPLTPLLAHFGLIVLLYAALTAVRVEAVWRGRSAFSDFVRSDGDSPLGLRIARNLTNQFELAIFAWIAVLLAVATDRVGALDLWALWLFFVGRVIHTVVQIGTTNVRLRGLVYLITAVSVIWLMSRVSLEVFFPSDALYEFRLCDPVPPPPS